MGSPSVTLFFFFLFFIDKETLLSAKMCLLTSLERLAATTIKKNLGLWENLNVAFKILSFFSRLCFHHQSSKYQYFRSFANCG